MDHLTSLFSGLRDLLFWFIGTEGRTKKYSPMNRKLMSAMIQFILNLSETGQTVGTVQTTEYLTALKADIEFKENW